MIEETQIMDGTAEVAPPATTPEIAGESFSFSSEVVVISDPRGARAEAIRTLRTHIMAQHVDDGRRGLAVCAASAGVGATFVAVNLAVALAQIGVKVLLIDGDLRNGAVEQYVRPPRTGPGLRQCLEDRDLDVALPIQPDVLDNLSIMFSGGRAANAQELLASDRFGAVIERCLRDYDLTIIDTPPANSCADGRRISTVSGYAIIVARRHQSFINDLRTLADQLSEDRALVIGTILNEA